MQQWFKKKESSGEHVVPFYVTFKYDIFFYSYPGALNTTVSNVNVWVANHYFKVSSNLGLCEENCDKCLYGLNGQYTTGSINQDIDIAVNRVIYRSSRNGHGLCYVKLKWVEYTTE